MARPTGGPGKGRVELHPAVPGGSLRNSRFTRGRALSGVPGWGLRTHSGTALRHREENRTAGAPGRVPGRQPSSPRRPGPGREQEAAFWGGFERGTQPGGRRGVPSRGTCRPTPSPPGLIWFPHPQRPSRTRGRGRGPVESRPLLPTGRGLKRRAGAGGGAGGKGGPRGAPSTRGQPLPAARVGGERPRPGEVDAHPARTKDPHPRPRKAALRERGRAAPRRPLAPPWN